MAGLPKQKQYQYSKEGKFIKEFESLTEVVEKYGKTKGKFYTTGLQKRMNDGTWICQTRVGKKEIMKLEKIYNCPFCIEGNYHKKPIEVYNLVGEKIAEFNSASTFEKMTGISRTTAQAKAAYGNKTLPKSNNLIIKYKK